MKRFPGSIFLMGLLVFCSSTSYACSCVAPDIPTAFTEANAVFVGEVIDIIAPKTYDENSPLNEHFFTIKFKVEKSWKGATSNEADVLSAQGIYSCFDFPLISKGEKYLVYAYLVKPDGVWQKGLLVINGCGRTTRIPDSVPGIVDRFKGNGVEAIEDLKALEEMLNPPPDFRSPDLRFRPMENTPLRILQPVYY